MTEPAVTASADAASVPSPSFTQPWYKRGIGGILALLAVLASKGKILLLGLTKLKTLLSMFAFFGVYWSMYGWPLALGLVLSIYIHEMGHVAALRQLGIDSSMPLFIPFVGAFVMLKQHVTDPSVDAKIGLAGPVWGLGAGVAAYLGFRLSGDPIWAAIATLTGFINLFNLIPVWQLDGSRGFHALSRGQRWVAVFALAFAFVLTGQKLLLIVGAVALIRAFQRVETKGDSTALGTYIMLVGALSWLSVRHLLS